MLTERRPIGGHLLHLVPAGKRKALCGYEPKAVRKTGRLMAFRHGWSDAQGLAFGKCKRCQEVAAKET